MTPATCRRLVVLYGIGGLSDVGRHAILAALEKPSLEKITVISEYPELLDEKNWECGCVGGHTNPFNDSNYSSRLEMVKIESWKNDEPRLAQHFEGADAIVSCLGHRQPGMRHSELIKRGLIAYEGNRKVIKAMEEANIDRVVVISSIALNGDKSWPHWANNVMAFLFKTLNKKARKDLEAMEEIFLESPLDYLFVKPVGIGENVVPVGKYFLQKPGDKSEVVGGNMAKMDVASFMIDEAVSPTFHRTSKTVGAEPGSPM